MQEAQNWGATRHGETQYEKEHESQPARTIEARCLVEHDRVCLTTLQPVEYFGPKEEQRCPQQAEIDEGDAQGEENAQVKAKLAQEAAPFQRMAWATEQ